jgi:hypothetical protein
VLDANCMVGPHLSSPSSNLGYLRSCLVETLRCLLRCNVRMVPCEFSQISMLSTQNKILRTKNR